MSNRSCINFRMAGLATGLLVFVVVGCEREGPANESEVSELPYELGVASNLEFAGFAEGSDDLLVSDALHATWHGDGELLLIDQRAPGAWLLDPLGEVIRRVGQAGDGPGEYRSPRYGGFLGDSAIWISDSELRRITVWDRGDGSVLSASSAPVERLREGGMRAEGRWLMDSGLTLGVPVLEFPPRPGVVTMAWPVPIWTGSEATATVLVDLSPVPLQGRMVFGTEDQRVNMVVLPQAFDGVPLQGTFDGGAQFFVVDRSEAAERPEAGVTIWISDSSADSVRHIRIAAQPPSVPGPWRDRLEAEARILADAIPPHPTFGAASEERILEATWIPSYLPPIRNAFFDVEGIWLEEVPAEPSSSTVVWSRYDLEGGKLGEVELPSRFRGLAGRRNAIVGFVMDSLQVPQLERYDVSGY